MAERTLRELLNRLRWGGQTGAGVEIAFVGRDEEGESVDQARFDEVVEILPTGVTLAGGAFIPYHRFRLVRRGTEALWRSRGRRRADGE